MEQLARDVFEPLAAHDGRLDRPLIQALGEHGLLGRVLDDEVPALDLCLIREGLARYCTEAETAFAVQGLGTHPILANGSPQVVEPLARIGCVPRPCTANAVSASVQ